MSECSQITEGGEVRDRRNEQIQMPRILRRSEGK